MPISLYLTAHNWPNWLGYQRSSIHSIRRLGFTAKCLNSQNVVVGVGVAMDGFNGNGSKIIVKKFEQRG